MTTTNAQLPRNYFYSLNTSY